MEQTSDNGQTGEYKDSGNYDVFGNQIESDLHRTFVGEPAPKKKRHQPSYKTEWEKMTAERDKERLAKKFWRAAFIGAVIAAVIKIILL
jgi:hypothetical protein